MRAYYHVATNPPIGEDSFSNATVLYRDTEAVLLLSALDPNPALEEIGGIRLGSRLSELEWPVIELITNTRVRRIVEGEIEELIIPTASLMIDDEILEENIPSVMVAGDSIEDYR